MVRLNLTPSPNCPRCGKAVYAAESIIGPAGKSYHKPCLSCIVCRKRLDSTLLLEHEGEAFCRNCHRAHLGQGKGGFGLSVPLQPKIPPDGSAGTASTRTTPTAPGSANDPQPVPSSEPSEDPSIPRLRPRDVKVEKRHDEGALTLADHVPEIHITSRGKADDIIGVQTRDRARDEIAHGADGSAPISETSSNGKSPRSIDDIIASGVEVPTPISRLSSARARGAGPGHPTAAPSASSARSASSAPQHGQTSTATTGIIGSVASPAEVPVIASQASAQRSVPPPAPGPAPAPAPAPKPANLSSTANMTITKTAAMSARGEPQIPSSSRSIDHSSSVNGLPAPKRVVPPRASIGKTAPSAGAAHATNGGVSAASIAIGATDLSPGRGVRNQGLASSVRAGTPLCARCSKAVYFAEQLTAAGRLWHRACLRCDGCRTTLEPSKLEEGPIGAEEYAAEGERGCNVWCRTCYKKLFGPKGIGVAGMSLPEAHISPRR